ncbi:aldo/keto reductase [uncultured Prevotella sp.]|uniref:aldo/keto reductase family protein n=1 Tax=uncultured Prevotella sp. TaxID=159272 RepID=UPI002629949D|nr:aldo/keto reductase [uncultured Prevotella sp.]
MKQFELPKIFFGSYQLNDYLKIHSVLSKCVDLNVRAFDMAPGYQTEELIGSFLKDIYIEKKLSREDFFLTTKVDNIHIVRGNIEEVLDNSLKKVGVDYFDLLLMHWPYPNKYMEAWEVMENLKSKGKCKHIGICNARVRHLKPMLERGMVPEVLQTEIHPFRVAEDLVAFCHLHEIAVQAYSPLCRMIPPIRNSRELIALSLKYNKTVSQIMLRWHIDRFICPVTMSSKPERVMENVDIFDFSLTKEEIDLINSLDCDYHNFPESVSCPGY